jgi:hypothetical protein
MRGLGRITKVVTTALRAQYTDLDKDEKGAAGGFLIRARRGKTPWTLLVYNPAARDRSQVRKGVHRVDAER